MRISPFVLSGALVSMVACAHSSPSRPAEPAPRAAGASPAEFAIEGPLKFAARPTTADITPIDLMSRLYIFADDSMMGRDDGGPLGATRATNYIEHELRRLGLRPAGDNGGFFQDIGYRTVTASPASTINVDGATLVAGRDMAPVPRVGDAPLRGDFQVIYGGGLDDPTPAITSAQANGKIVILTAVTNGTGVAGGAGGGGRGGRGGAFPAPIASVVSAAAAVVVALGDSLNGNTQSVRGILPDSVERINAGPRRINVTRAAAARMLGGDIGSLRNGAPGRPVHLDISVNETHFPVRNVVAIQRGSDPKLSGEYVAIGAHLDHVGFTNRPVDHDSLRAFNKVMRPRGLNDQLTAPPTAEQWTSIRHLRDSLSKLHPARMDSISNGADDDGSGSVALLEIAENFARGPAKPKRSIVFVWHASEEDGLYGSKFFTSHPTVPRDSIVAQLNMDMVGRGRATDHAGGGPEYLRLIGSRRLSTELGDIVERVNTEGHNGYVFDYTFDAPGHPQNSYCRSDHANYARFGIPIVFFGTGVEADYHMVTDEPQYIDYPHMAHNVRFIRDVGLAVANLDHRPVVDKPKPDPHGACRQ